MAQAPLPAPAPQPTAPRPPELRLESALDASWPREREAAALRSREVASRTGLVWLDSPRWQHRRVDSVEFGDATTVCRRSSIDFTVPEQAAVITRADGVAVRVVPLALLRKQPLVAFDLRDEADSVLPMLTAEQNGALATGMLVALAEAILGDVPHARIQDDLASIALAPRGQGRRLLHSLEAVTSDVVEDDQRNRLRGSVTFLSLARQLASNFVLAVLVEDQPGVRRVVKFRHEERIGLGGLRGLSTALGWRATAAHTDVHQAVDPASYHFEACAPIGVEIAGLQLRGHRPGPVAFETTSLEVAGGRQRAHVVAADLPAASRVQAVVALRAERRGWLRSSWLLSLLAPILITVVLWRVGAGEANRGALGQSATLLLGLNGVLAALLVRTTEHALAARLLSKLRVVALVSAVLPFVVAATLVFGPTGAALTGLLLGYLVLSLAAAIVLTLGYFLPRTPPPFDG